MNKMKHMTRSDRGFTLVELLVVMLILGGLTSIVVLAITSFLGEGTVEAANAEVHQARAAIEACFSEAGVTGTDNGTIVNWDGTEDMLTVTGSDGTVYDAADYLRGHGFKATYIVSGSGEITGVTVQDWGDLAWVDDHWE
jgi:prepilin-type N-terminal cleavage/methylation domain-containing protein